eukprot:4718785-Amphidinium_carterae.1
MAMSLAHEAGCFEMIALALNVSNCQESCHSHRKCTLNCCQCKIQSVEQRKIEPHTTVQYMTGFHSIH